MDKHDLKALLKDGKVCAKKKDYNGALQAGKTVLRYEENNYTALVLVAFGLQEKDPAKSLEYYKKGAKIMPNELTCWQGIATHFEMKGDKKHPDLIEAYNKLEKLHREGMNMDKYAETVMKHAGALQSQGDFSGCVKTLQGCINTSGHSDKLDQMVVQAVGQMKPPLGKAEEEVYLSCLLSLHEFGSATDANYKALFPVLYQAKQFDTLRSVCLALHPKFNAFYQPIECLCRLYLENQFKADPTEMQDLISKLFKLYPSSTFGYLAQGKVASERGRYAEAIAWLKGGLESKIHTTALQLVIKLQLQIWDFPSAEDYCLLAKKKLKIPNVYDDLYAYALAGQEKWKELKTLVKTLKNQDLANIMTANIALHEENWDEFDRVVNQLSTATQSWEVQYFKGFKSSQSLSALCMENQDNLECLLKCGIQLMKLEDYENAVLPFNKCLALASGHPIALYYLGKLHVLGNDMEAAKKFLSKAFETLPTPEIGSYLSDLYSDLGDNEANKKLLLAACKNSKKSKSKWAWLRLGVLNLHEGEANDAVVALQSCVRTDIQDCHIWEALADAYYARGSYEAAAKAYNQCIKLGADPVYPRLRIGVINGHLGLEDLAVESLEALGDYVPALVELCKTWLQIAQKRVQEGLDQAAQKAILEGLVAATRALRLDTKEQILPLILVAHLTLVASRLNPESKLEVPAFLLTPDPAIDHTVVVCIDMSTFFMIGVHVLVTALSKPLSRAMQCSMHTDLSKLYYYLATKCGSTAPAGSIEKAVYHGKKAVSLGQKDCATWNTLGVIAFAANDLELAQHCIIRSLELNSTGNPQAWANMGFLYIANDEATTGHECLKEAQSSEPGYGRTWIGMGLVAEGFAVHREEAMDLFRHSMTIPDTHEFAALAYGEFLCKSLQDEYLQLDADHKSVHAEAVTQTPEHISLYNARSPTSVSLNVEGYIKLHAGQLWGAIAAFRAAATKTTDPQELEIVNQNLIVALLEDGEYEEAFELVQKLTTPSFVALAGAAHAADRLEKHEAAFTYYEQARNLIASASPIPQIIIQISDTLVGQACVAYKMGNHDLAKTLLFKGCQGRLPNFLGYVALCSFGLLTGDIELATSALAEMSVKCDQERNIPDITQLQAYCLVAQAPEPKPLRCILTKIHSYPTVGRLRRLLALHLINLHGDGTGARRHLLTTRRVGGHATEGGELAAVALTYLIDGDYDNALKYGKASLRVNMGDPASYAVLVATLNSRGDEADVQLAAKLKNMALGSGRLVPGSRLQEWFNSV